MREREVQLSPSPCWRGSAKMSRETDCRTVGCEEVGQSAETELWTEVSTEIESETELWTETSTEIKTETELYLNGTETETEADFAETETEQVAEYSTLAAVKQIGFQVTPQNAKLTVQDAERKYSQPGRRKI